MDENGAISGLEEGFIEVPGGNVWYGIAGADAPGLPLLTLHGGPGAPHDYLEPLCALSAERPVIFYDQLGCGNSERTKDTSLFTVARFVDELRAVREALSLTRLHIMGQSWGSMLAVEYMLTLKPEGVAGLVLSGPCFSARLFVADQRKYLAGLPVELQRVIVESEAAGDFEGKAYQDAITAYYRLHVCRMDPWPECMERSMEKFGQSVYTHMWGPSEFTMTGTLADFDRTGELRLIDTPVLLTAGQYDETGPGTMAHYRGLFPHAEMVILEGASHMHHLERPEAYMEAVGPFLRKHDGPPGDRV